MSGQQPEFALQTERLAIRRLTLADADLMLSVWNDPAFYKYVGDRGIHTIDDARVALQEGAFQLYEKYGYGPFRIAIRENDQAIGTCGLFRREGFDDPDIGWSILPEFCGKGFAYEAACAVLEYGITDVSLTRVVAFISAENAPSIGLAKKLGLRYERMTRLVGDDEDVCLYSMTHDREAI
ncbi:MAG: GNAT family N-acetyltransferase [Woeseiaceae bacterium]